MARLVVKKGHEECGDIEKRYDLDKLVTDILAGEKPGEFAGVEMKYSEYHGVGIIETEGFSIIAQRYPGKIERSV
jgi:hypothetical protein